MKQNCIKQLSKDTRARKYQIKIKFNDLINESKREKHTDAANALQVRGGTLVAVLHSLLDFFFNYEYTISIRFLLRLTPDLSESRIGSLGEVLSSLSMRDRDGLLFINNCMQY